MQHHLPAVARTCSRLIGWGHTRERIVLCVLMHHMIGRSWHQASWHCFVCWLQTASDPAPLSQICCELVSWSASAWQNSAMLRYLGSACGVAIKAEKPSGMQKQKRFTSLRLPVRCVTCANHSNIVVFLPSTEQMLIVCRGYYYLSHSRA